MFSVRIEQQFPCYILETVDYISQALAKKKPVDVIYLDFAKAFDKVSHRLLLYKLAKYGIQGRLLAWIGDFLSMRRQRVVLGDTCSDWTSVDSGVPQGSVLGPTLFALFVNDLPDAIRNICKLFADDTKILSELLANGMLAPLRNTFRSRNTNLWKKLYITYVRPLLEYSIQAWSPYLQKDIDEIEKVQRRATKIPYALKGLS